MSEASSSNATAGADPKHFGGPWGAALMMVALPALSLYLWLCVHRHGGALVWPSAAALAELPVPTPRAAAYYFGWIAFQIALDVLLPGKTVPGLPRSDGSRLTYRLNGLLSLVVSLAVLGALAWAGVVTGTSVLTELGPMLVVAIGFSYLLGAFLYVYGLRSPRAERRSGHVVYDYFMGTALNPRVGSLDLKMFFESKIGMSTWIVIALAMAAAQIEARGTLHSSMVLVCVFQLLYVVDFYFFEDAMLSTWDINYENYGYMLAFGFVVWMPFNFSLQAQYLVTHAPSLSMPAIVALVLMNFAGYYVFRSSNLQKHRFRTEPETKIWGKEPRFIQTRRGTKLLTSGWWGLARHANYFGDLTMALAWCLPCGFSHLVPYFYFLYFAPLLVDRERRDHRVCAEKYGPDWDTYCRQVKYRIVPGIY